MLKINEQQFAAFEQDANQNFENEMVSHSKEFSPRLCEVIGDEQLRIAVRQAISRSQSYGFSNRGPIRLYIELMFLRGSNFDTDPQYVAMGERLRAPAGQMERAERVHQEFLAYLEEVSGPDAVNVRNALKALARMAEQPLEFGSRDFTSDMVDRMRRAFPQKAAYVGEAQLVALVDEGRAEARKFGFSSPRAEALIVILMYAFGHGCTDDPLYPWISQTLKDERITDAAQRAERLERRATTWLDHVIARLQRQEDSRGE